MKFFKTRWGKFAARRRKALDVVRYFPIFKYQAPHIQFDENLYLTESITFSAAEKFPKQLLQLLRGEDGFISYHYDDYEDTEAGKKLGNLFDDYGSDKNNFHAYTPFYADLLTRGGGEILFKFWRLV